MKARKPFQFSTGVVAYPLAFVLTIWLVFWAEVRFGFSLNEFGIYPKTLSGLRGVLFSPFIHGDVEHLWHNTLPLLILSTALFYFYRPVAWRVLGLGVLLSGLLTWIIATKGYHIGISGLIYVLASFLFFKGIFAKHFRLIALSLIVVFLYGSMVWYTMPIKAGMSWEGHLSGFLVGLLFAFVFRQKIAKPETYDWEHEDYNEEEDEFLKHFDEDGNFIEELPEEDEPDSSVNYIYKEEE